jgi:flavin reductase (DIM6/NTAB) family NADH-FMN oxidoreductase RutF
MTSLQAISPGFSQRQFRAALSQFATGVTVVTACTDGGQPFGVTVNSFSSVSLEPPLVLWGLAISSGTRSVFCSATHYVINVLGADQIDLSQCFSKPQVNRFADVPYVLSTNGAPILPQCIACFECNNRNHYREGDHLIFIGEVERCHMTSRSPLIFYSGAYHIPVLHPSVNETGSLRSG